ncbi:MAG: hypothetical protein J2P57_05245 [Acidimicrobiaceae bacterium]|nr:hypothetical protein [Acidimicrobiaceae bacterium]
MIEDRFSAARSVADATLYEGYVLYPYRASARKNQVRWQFGVLAPPEFCQENPSERSTATVQCLIDPEPVAAPILHVRLRGLHVQRRTVEHPSGERPGRLEVDGILHVDWDEAVDVAIDLDPLSLEQILGRGVDRAFRLDAHSSVEELLYQDGSTAGRLVREREAVDGRVQVTATRGRYWTVTVTAQITSPSPPAGASRQEALAGSLVAAHVMLALDGGRFVSLLDPPAGATEAAAQCHSDGIYPVLIGDDRVLLASPIILYDHPEVAPESPGDLYDSTEIDEILALRVLTLTDDEKAEARGTDARAAAVIDRCDSMPPEVWARLHGTLRSVEPSVPWWDPGTDASVDPNTDSVTVDGTSVTRGTSVRLRPSRRADAQDLFLKDRLATVAGVFRDVDDLVYVAVTLDDDPASAELEWQGRYLYFYPDELELR